MEEKMRILNMVSEGKITPEEAEKLLGALDSQITPGEPPTSLTGSLESKFLYVQVEPKEEGNSERVSVKVPFALLKAGLNITGLIPEEAQEKLNSSMQEKGLNFNWSDLNKDNIQELLSALEQLTVDVDSDDSTVKVYCK